VASAGVCYGCYLDDLTPAWFAHAEDYALSRVYARKGEPIPVARRRPRTGVELLDGPRPPRIVDVLAAFAAGHVAPKLRRRMQAYLMHMAATEATMGLEDDF
jgi:hypothetical protein